MSKVLHFEGEAIQRQRDGGEIETDTAAFEHMVETLHVSPDAARALLAELWAGNAAYEESNE